MENYKYLVQDEFSILVDKLPNYSFAEILYSVLSNLEGHPELGWLYEVKDRDLLIAIENATNKEIEND